MLITRQWLRRIWIGGEELDDGENSGSSTFYVNTFLLGIAHLFRLI